MHPLAPGLLLLLDLAFCDSEGLIFKYPKTIYAWEQACVWIPCTYKNKQNQEQHLDNFTLYHNPEYDKAIKDYNGTILYTKTKTGEHFTSDGRVQKTENNCTLSINPVSFQDSGTLGMRVKWREGGKEEKWMAELHLNVSKTPPPPHLQLLTSRIVESQSVTASCFLNFSCFGYDIKLWWSLEGLNSTSSSKDSTSLSTDNVFTKSDLTFQPRWTHHKKNLSCRVLHSSTVLSEETVQLDVKHTPKLKIEVSPRDAVVMKGEFVNMTCQVTSSNPEYKTISWLKNGNLMKEQQQPTLTLSKVTKEMAGTYHCQASNDVGLGRSEEVNLKVLYAPEPSMVQIHPSPGEEGKLVELICVSSANPPAKNYTWHHNGNEIPEKTEEKLCISQVSREDAGNYSCLAENVYGRGQSGQVAELHVQYPPKEVTVVIQNSTLIREGDSVKLVCRYHSSNPDVSHYYWTPGSSLNKPINEVLWVYKVAWDTPPITCKACNQWCSESSPVSLDVQYAPRDVKILQIRPQSEILAGHQVVLRCDFSQSRPKDVHFFWMKNGSLLKEGQELVFNSTSPEDAGNYSCSINNSIGQTTSKTWRLQVLYAPRRLHVSITPGHRVMEGRKAALTCESDANPPASHYAWFDWNNQDLQYSGKTLRLESLKIKHSGSYWCQGSNRLGTAESAPSTLTVYYSPESIGRRVAIGIGSCLAIVIIAIWGVKFQQQKRAQSRQGLQDNSSSQSFFVRNKKVRRATLSEGPQSLGCYNPVIEDSISYATLHFPETDAPRTRDAGTSETQRPLPSRDDTVTYSVVQRRHVGDYENMVPDLSEDEGIHYSELVKFGVGEPSPAHENVEYVTLKH